MLQMGELHLWPHNLLGLSSQGRIALMQWGRTPRASQSTNYLPVRLTAATAALSAPFLMSFSTSTLAMCVS